MSQIISQEELRALSEQSRSAPRKRVHRNFHATYDEPVQRLLIAMQPGSYVRPHQHADDHRWEFMLALAGCAGLLEFDAAGTVLARYEMRPGGAQVAIEISAHTWHTLFALEPDTVLMEFKPGPYVAPTDKDFALWAPTEGAPECERLCAWYAVAQPGQRYCGA